MEIIPATALKYLPFSPEPLSQWNNDTDLLQFLYELHDKQGLMVTADGKNIPVNYRDYGKEIYNRGIENFQLVVQNFIVAAQQATPAPGSATQVITVPNFSEESIFGKLAKYMIAWDGILGEVLSNSAFFSITHILESDAELKCSIHLALNLYYKQALQVLRSFLEEVILPIHFYDNPKEFLDWKSNSYKVPSMRGDRGLLKSLVKRKKISQEIADEVANLYGDLNGCIHGNERRLIHRGFHTASWIGHVFKYDDFCDWCEYLCRSVKVGIQLMRINIKQWESFIKPDKIKCRICHNEKGFTTESFEFGGKNYIDHHCCKCGEKITLYMSKPAYTVHDNQTGKSWMFVE